MWPLKDSQNLTACREVLPLRICARHVAAQLAVRTCGALKEEGQVTDIGHALRSRDQHPKRMAFD